MKAIYLFVEDTIIIIKDKVIFLKEALGMNKNNVVGVDIDCVLTELQPTMDFMADFFGKESPSLEDVLDYNLSDTFGIEEEECLSFWENEEHEICKNSVLSEDRYQSILKNFTDEDSAIVLVTSRDKKHTEVTSQWLEDNGISYDMLIMTSGECKKPIIETLDMKYMIDDKPDLFHTMNGSKTKMICVDYEYNKDVPSDFRMTKCGRVYNN